MSAMPSPRRQSSPVGPEVRRRQCLVLAAAALGAAIGPARARAVTVLEGRWHDESRRRELPWRLRLPDGTEHLPLVLHSHGLGGSREGGAAWGQAWAASGIAVLHLQHPGSDRGVFTRRSAGGPEPGAPAGAGGALARAATPQQLMERVADVRFMLDQIERRAGEGGPWRRLRGDAIGMSGHSFGAHTALALAGQRHRVPLRGLPAGGEARIRAFIAFSPASPRAASVHEAFGAIRRPTLLMTGSDDGDPFGSYATGEPRAAVYDGLPSAAQGGRRALLWLEGADHRSFGGGGDPRPDARGPARALQARHQALIERISADWWRAHLLGDADAARALEAPAGLAQGDRWRMD